MSQEGFLTDCPPCQAPVPTVCLGGHTKDPLPCCEAAPFSCGAACGRLLACSNHSCSKPCHAISLPPSSQDGELKQVSLHHPVIAAFCRTVTLTFVSLPVCPPELGSRSLLCHAYIPAPLQSRGPLNIVAIRACRICVCNSLCPLPLCVGYG